MKTIIVPTDFSSTASNAVDYAIAMAKEINASIVLLNAYQVPVAVTADTPIVVVAEEDLRRRQVIEARTEADIVKRAAEKALAERGQELISETEQATVRSAIERLEESMRGDDHLLIREKIKELDEASRHLAELIMDRAVSSALKNRDAAEVAEQGK